MSQPLSISTIHEQDVCDVCMRTLLRGERAEVFLSGGRRYKVCELCKPHALHEGWMREGAVPDYASAGERLPRRRGLFGRRRARTERGVELQPPQPRSLDDELSIGSWGGAAYAPVDRLDRDPYDTSSIPSPATERGSTKRGRTREPRHVHAIPTSADHKMAVAVDVFNVSSHRRTVAGVARSLGAPSVTIASDATHPSIVWIIVYWELCWYRYEIDLSDPEGQARLDAQGYELSELGAHEQLGNGASDESGALILY